jgi:hypothetical protein
MVARTAAAAAAALVVMVAAARAAAADDADGISDARTPVLVGDIAAGTLMVATYASGSLITGYSALGLYLVGAPVAHAIAGDGLTSTSFGRRLVFPLGAGLAGVLIGIGLEGDDCDDDCHSLALLGGGLGLLAGGVLASVLDYRDASDLSTGEPEPMMFTYGGGF